MGVSMAYTIGGISGCHINPAITLGCLISGRINGKDATMYMVFQVIGAIIGSAVLFLLVKMSGTTFQSATLTGANGIQLGHTVGSAFIVEVIFTFVFVLVVLGTTDSKKGAGNLAGLAIGLSLILVHIVCIPITGTSVNPARSIGPAIFEAVNGSMESLGNVWIFIVAPFIGAFLSAYVWKSVAGKK